MTTSAAIVPEKAVRRRGPCANTVFHVVQPYPLPVASAARMSTTAPPNIGRPCTSVAGSCSSDMSPSCARARNASPSDSAVR